MPPPEPATEPSTKKMCVLTKPKQYRKPSGEANAPNIPYTDHVAQLALLTTLRDTPSTTTPLTKFVLRELGKKRSSYRSQDVRKKKHDEAALITVPEIVTKLCDSQLICYYCRLPVYICYDEIRQANQWTLDRLDNDLGHTRDNVVIACLQCNLQRREKTSAGFVFAKQLKIVRHS